MSDTKKKALRDEERRSYFRVDDVIPLCVQKSDSDEKHIKNRMVAGPYSYSSCTSLDISLPPPTSLDPQLWKILTEIDNKLTMILDALHPDNRSYAQARNTPVSISASGLQFSSPIPFSEGDLLEIRMLLQINSPTWFILYGHVVRSRPIASNEHQISTHYCRMEEEIRDRLSLYCFRRQRELLRMERSQHEC